MEEHESKKERGDDAGEATVPAPRRALEWAARVWRPGATALAVALALLLTWHVVNGKHGVSVWRQKQVEDQQLRKEIQDLEQENARLRQHIDHLKNDPEAIEHEAREKLHYAKPGEVIYTLPPTPQNNAPAAGSGK